MCVHRFRGQVGTARLYRGHRALRVRGLATQLSVPFFWKSKELFQCHGLVTIRRYPMGEVHQHTKNCSPPFVLLGEHTPCDAQQGSQVP